MLKYHGPVIVLNGEVLEYDSQSLIVDDGYLWGDVQVGDKTYNFNSPPSNYWIEKHASGALKVIIDDWRYGLRYECVPVAS